MMESYFARLATARRGLLLGGLLLAAAPAAHAQLYYTPGTATNTAGTYTDLGSNGTAIATANTDNANSAAQDIGFTFTFNQQTFTQFVLNTNGLLRLGAAAPAAALAASPYAQAPELSPLNSANAADANLLLPFNFDLTAGSSTPEYRVYTSGRAGSRICTVQWKNVADKAVATDASTGATIGSQLNNFAFQVKLYEGSNRIDFVYSSATSGGATALKYAVVGIKGSSGTLGNTVLATKASVDTWDAATFLTGRQYGPDQGPQGFNAFNFRSTYLPDAGRTFSFTPCTPAVATTFPYTETFNALSEGQLTCGTSGEDVNQDAYTWSTLDISGSGDIALVYSYNEDDNTVGGNEWFYTQGLTLRAGYRYQLKFDYAVSSAQYPEGLEVKWGTAATPAAQTNLLFSNTGINNETFLTTTNAQVVAITPATTGVYYIGFHEISAPDEEALGIDNLVVTETQVLPVRNAATAVFTAEAAPVPFGDHLSLHLTTLKAGPLALTLRDVLGRAVRQHTTIAPLGSSTVALPEVASLPGGIYLLTIEQGGQSQVLRLTHQ